MRCRIIAPAFQVSNEGPVDSFSNFWSSIVLITFVRIVFRFQGKEREWAYGNHQWLAARKSSPTFPRHHRVQGRALCPRACEVHSTGFALAHATTCRLQGPVLRSQKSLELDQRFT